MRKKFAKELFEVTKITKKYAKSMGTSQLTQPIEQPRKSLHVLLELLKLLDVA